MDPCTSRLRRRARAGRAAFVPMVLVRRLVKARPLQVTVPWQKIAGAETNFETLAFRSKVHPKGWIYFTTESPQIAMNLANELRLRSST